MLYCNIAFILICGILYVLSAKKSGNLKNTVDKKEHKLYFLYPISELLLDKAGLYKVLKRKDQTAASVRALNVTGNSEIAQKLYWCSKISMLLFILILFDILSVLGQLKSQSTSGIVNGGYLIRPESGEGNHSVELNVTMDRLSPTNQNSPEAASHRTEDITIDVGERKLTEEELTILFEKAKEYLDKSILGSNQRDDLIYENLYFCNAIPGTGISVKWQPADTRLVGWDGTIQNENLDPGGTNTVISAVLTCQDSKIDYEKKLKIMPKQYTQEEQLNKQLKQEIDTSQNSNREDKRLKLPEEAGDYRLSWKEKEQNTGMKIFLLGILAAVCIWFYGDRELARKMKVRKEQMLLDYPDIINKFTLLVNAGMTVRQAWFRITKDYEKKQEAGSVKKRYAYEEMQVTVHELNLGIPEADAYEQFGRRAGLIPYMKFGSLIAQNLKKGNKGISELLTKEAVDAFEERKETAKRLGEEAGTKLLVPMMIMLVIVFAVIMVPAFLSFRL